MRNVRLSEADLKEIKKLFEKEYLRPCMSNTYRKITKNLNRLKEINKKERLKNANVKS